MGMWTQHASLTAGQWEGEKLKIFPLLKTALFLCHNSFSFLYLKNSKNLSVQILFVALEQLSWESRGTRKKDKKALKEI